MPFDDFVVVYLDDIVIYSETLEEHVQHVRQVFNRLRENELYAKPSKCSFAQTSINFLGHIIEQGKIRIDSIKVTAIRDWQPPKTVYDVRSFLGLCNYYRRFVKGYSVIALSLIELTKKDEDWDWSSQCQTSFERLKKSMWTNLILALPNMTKPLEVHIDASYFALGGVLMQEGHPIAYETRKLNQTERRYSAHEKELLATPLSQRMAELSPQTRDQIRALMEKDRATQYLVDLIKQGKTRQFWPDGELVKIKEDRLYIPKSGDMRKITNYGMPGHDLGRASRRETYLCTTQDKAEHQKKAGLLEPLSVPIRPFESVSMGYIIGLPKVMNFGTIIVVVDRLSKYATFIAAPKYVFAEETTQLFFKPIVKYWGLPKDIQPLLPYTVDIERSTKSPQMKNFSQEWKRNIEIAKSYLEKAQKRYKKSADLKRRFIELNIGDLAMIFLPNAIIGVLVIEKSSKFTGVRPLHQQLISLSISVKNIPEGKIGQQHNIEDSVT
ncbi:uncharacterized protein LOC111366751 [Olea europaea var. sylvestris]|uniref:uncharacterized protein LOC111366751 n=1 Tax=Olea europaea var. sylvestris TaxID=158386 RepID=UPI000C1D4F29|nr:uncharacterized protein LOC111366751 [Olea europaea var. sylvestris]